MYVYRFFVTNYHRIGVPVYLCVFVGDEDSGQSGACVGDVYSGLESIVKNLLTSLRAVNELQNSAVRERHWQQLMRTTGVNTNQHSLTII